MARVSRSPSELSKQLDEQLRFIKNSAQSFDEGFDGEAKRLAVTIRVLVHDTGQSHSLLTQLGLKKAAQFHDLSIPFDPTNRAPHSGLTRFWLRSGGVSILPLFDECSVSPRLVSFDVWWNGIAFVDKGRVEYSRKNIVLALANEDGGAHVAPTLDGQYANLSRNNSLGWTETRDGVERPAPDQVPAAVRHIAHELLKSLDWGYKFDEPDRTSPGVLVHGVAIREKKPKVGRNASCPCGSGKKYKKCHGA